MAHRLATTAFRGLARHQRYAFLASPPRALTASTTRIISGAAAQRVQEQIEESFDDHAFIKEAIKRLVIDKQDQDDAAQKISDEALKESHDGFLRLYDEAERCLMDCKEASQAEYDEEHSNASAAVDKAFAGFLDFIENLQYAGPQQCSEYKESRIEAAKLLRDLRSRLSDMQLDR